MHVISDDFDSAYLKTKKHWNSFTSPFFVFYKDFVEILNDKGAVYVCALMLVDAPMRHID